MATQTKNTLLKLVGLNPSLSEVSEQPIPSNSLNTTRIAGLAAVITGVAAALDQVLKIPDDAPNSLKITFLAAKAGVIVASLFAFAIVIAHDARARAEVAPQKLVSGADGSAKAPSKTEGETPAASTPRTGLATSGALFKVKLSQDQGGPYPALAISWKDSDKWDAAETSQEMYLIVKESALEWVPRSKVSDVHFEERMSRIT